MQQRTVIWSVAVILCLGWSACTRDTQLLQLTLKEAQAVVAQADSLRAEGRMYGIDEGDSARLAQTYETLKKHSAFCRRFSEHCSFVPCTSSLGTYAHACYHYGRLLRERNNSVAAMQCFIDATHSRTRDYHILGRVYSNMGSIAHLAGEYALSYDMFERSAGCFLKNGDTINYYYALNEMAFEKAEQGEKEETLSLLATIESQCANTDVLDKTIETEINLYSRLEQYDSILSLLNLHPCYYTTNLVAKARAFEHLGPADSALFYARKVMTLPFASEQDKYNMLYIIINFDKTLRNDEIIELSSQRSDIETDVLIPLHNQWAMAIQLLEMEFNRKPDWRWLYAMFATLLFVGLIIGIYVSRKRKKRQLLSQQIDDLENKNNATIAQMKQQVMERCSILSHSPNIKDDLCWNDYKQMCSVVNQQFGLLASKLQQRYHLSEREIRLCVLVLMDGFTSKQMAELLFYAESGIRNLKSNTAKKLGTNGKEMHQFLVNLASEYA